MQKQIIIDVREPDEFHAEHIQGSLLVPLAVFQQKTASVFGQLPGDASVLIMCRSGKRASMAHEHAKALGLADNREISVYEGGILEWKRQSRPTQTLKENHFPIMRQVQTIAGTLVLLSSALGYWVHPNYLFIGAFVGAGLTLAGTTGFCGMAILLGKAPWNRVDQKGSPS